MLVKLLILPAIGILALFLAACGSSTPSTPTAASLAHEIPGCGNFTTDTPAVMEVAQVECTMPDGGMVTIGTFSSSSNESQWISDGGYPPTPDPAFAGCCIQGNGWAATVDGQIPLITYYNEVRAAIGGRMVNG